MTAHWVYRCFDVEGRPLYVGCTLNLFGRLDFHRANTIWAADVAFVTATVHPSKSAGLTIERSEIRRLDPAWNVRSRWQNNSQWTREDFDQFIVACEQSRWSHKLVANATRIRDGRFGLCETAA